VDERDKGDLSTIFDPPIRDENVQDDFSFCEQIFALINDFNHSIIKNIFLVVRYLAFFSV
jgi:hypothetical protein